MMASKTRERLITSGVRQDVAEALRWMRHETYYKEEIADNIEDAIRIADPVTTFVMPEDVYGLLADLIDPTCDDFGGEEGTNGEGYDFACGACGYTCDLPQPRYCPNCGRRIPR